VNRKLKSLLQIDLKIIEKSRYEFMFDFMRHISELPKMQMRFSTLEVTISHDNEVGFIHVFTSFSIEGVCFAKRIM
jgi:hypothetical protein